MENYIPIKNLAEICGFSYAQMRIFLGHYMLAKFVRKIKPLTSKHKCESFLLIEESINKLEDYLKLRRKDKFDAQSINYLKTMLK